MVQIVILDRSHLQAEHETFDYSSLEDLGELRIFAQTEVTEIVERAEEADVVVTGKLPLCNDVLRQLKKTKLIVKAGTSVSKFDLEAADSLGISVCNLPGYGRHPVAQWTLMQLLALAGSLYQYSSNVKNNLWNESQFAHPIAELRGAVIGVIGYGPIAKQLIKLAKPFEAQLLVHTRYPDDQQGVSFVDFDTILSSSDFLCLLSSLRDETRGLIDHSAIKKMKDGAYLINTSRAALMDENAVLSALNSGKLAGVALDGFWEEPANPGHKLFSMDNVIVTPHMAWASLRTRQSMINAIAERIKRFYQGNPLDLVTAGVAVRNPAYQ